MFFNPTFTSALMLVSVFSLAGCDQAPTKTTGQKTNQSVNGMSGGITPDQARPELARRKAASIASDPENYKIAVTLNCPSKDIFLDGSLVHETTVEKIIIMRERVEFGEPKDGKPRFYTTLKAEITSNGKAYEASLIGSSPGYALVSYGNLLKDGVNSNLFIASYMIDLTTKKFKRTVSFFEGERELTSEGQCQ